MTAIAPLRIYICGAHSTGKTTLARWIAKAYKLPMVNEVARAVLAERELPLDVLRSDLAAVTDYQQEVFSRQLQAELEAGDRFVSDRAFDSLAYTAAHTLGLSEFSHQAKMYADNFLNKCGSIVFLVRPHPIIMSDDGVRERADWEEIIRIDAMIRMLLELYNVDYVSLDALKMSERVRTIRAVLKAASVTRVTSGGVLLADLDRGGQ